MLIFWIVHLFFFTIKHVSAAYDLPAVKVICEVAALAVSESRQQAFWGVRIKVCFVKDAFEQEGFQSKVQMEKYHWGTMTQVKVP